MSFTISHGQMARMICAARERDGEISLCGDRKTFEQSFTVEEYTPGEPTVFFWYNTDSGTTHVLIRQLEQPKVSAATEPPLSTKEWISRQGEYNR
jgi:hypothetical protein